jgi:hypothetical protein
MQSSSCLKNYLASILCLLNAATLPAAQNEIMPVKSQTEFWGTETNGIRSWIYISPVNDQSISVHVQLNSNTNINSTFFNSSDLERRDPSGHGWKYFMATNLISGPMELCDAMGHKMPSLNPDCVSPEKWPSQYHLLEVWRSLIDKYKAYSGPPMPLPLAAQDIQISSFHLIDYYKIEKPGEYKLTIWPKIYKRVSPSNDICERIDIPPVSIDFKCMEKGVKKGVNPEWRLN